MYLLILSVKLIRCIPKCGEETGNLLLDSNNCFITSSSLEPPILCSGCISYKSAFDVICSCCQATWYIHWWGKWKKLPRILLYLHVTYAHWVYCYVTITWLLCCCRMHLGQGSATCGLLTTFHTRLLYAYSSQPDTRHHNSLDGTDVKAARRECGSRSGTSASPAVAPQTTPRHTH